METKLLSIAFYTLLDFPINPCYSNPCNKAVEPYIL